ncbi:sigma-70 family RNA polymerase sigma factor [Singulisphaera sp. PoT]|uniref:sigma-70 family RNA polymerase sigma factor n=1 Tax=Singulisphaera sp. PoT TaxID=3411797 RepID=UPI003BF51296
MARASSWISRDIETLFRVGTADGLGDRLLLDRFLDGGDDAGPAFEMIVARHGAMVLGVCRRVAGDDHAAEDAFQAAFLVLALRARAIRRRESLAPWLHGVAARVARRARDAASRRRRREVVVESPEPFATEMLEAEADELRLVLDEELGRLPGKYRDPLVLCYLEGLSQEEAARALGWTKGTVSGRLARAKEILRGRLSRRGLAPTAGFLATPLTLPSVMPAPLATAAVRAALAATIGIAEASGLPASALDHARRTIQAMTAIRWATISAISAPLILIALGTAGAWSMAARDDSPAPAKVPHRVAGKIADDQLPPWATQRFGSTRFRHTTRIESFAVSPDATFAVAASGTRISNSVRAYDLATGRVLSNFEDLHDVTSVAISPDGKTVAMTQREVSALAPTLRLYDTASGRETAHITYPPNDPLQRSGLLGFAPDGKHLIVEAADRVSMHLIRLDKGEVVRTFQLGGYIFAAVLSPDGKRIVAGGYDYDGNHDLARQWELDTGRDLGPILSAKGTVRCAAYSPDGTTIALGYEARKARIEIVDAATGKRRLEIPFPEDSIRSLAFSPDGKTIAASGDSTTRLFDASGKERLKIDRRAIGLRFSPDGATLIGAVAGMIEVWETATGRSLVPAGGESPVEQIAVTPDGKRIVTLGGEGDGHVWDAATGEHLRRVGMSWQRGFALSPDGRLLAWSHEDDTIQYPSEDAPGATETGSRLRLMDLTTGEFIERFDPFEGSANVLSFAPDGRTLMTADRIVRVWDLATGKVTRQFAATWKPRARIWRSRFSFDGTQLAMMYQGETRGLSVDSKFMVWDIAAGQEVPGPTPRWFTPELQAFAADGKTMAVARPPYGSAIQLQEVATGRVLGEFLGPPARVTSLAFGPDGRLYIGLPDGTVLARPPHAPGSPPAGQDRP